MQKLWLVLFSVFYSASVQASLDDCNAHDIVQVSVPVEYGRTDSNSFNLRFKFHRGGAGSPVVIVLPGGPGGTLIEGADGKAMLGSIPKSYSYVLTDPRGAGCNNDPALNDARYFRSRFLALDTLRIIRKLEELNGTPLNYILYGQSYGTLLATIAGSLAAAEGVTPPGLVVLEGVVGHSFRDFAEYFAAIQEQWHVARSALPASQRNKFMTGNFPLAPAKVWAYFVEQDLMAGYHPTRGSILNWHLGAGSMETMQLIGAIDAGTQHGEVVTPSRMGLVIACRELFGDLYMLRDFVAGELVWAGPNVCVGPLSGIQEPYDSKQWPLTMPVVYFEGDHDPATPPAQARYHFESQRNAQRYYVRLDLAAHGPLTTSLNAAQCPDRVWGSLTGDLSTLPQSLQYCDSVQPAKVSLEVRGPEQILSY